MPLNPIIERELRIALRVQKVTKSRLGVAIAGVVIVGIMLLLGSLVSGPTVGNTLHRWLFYLGLAFSIQPALSISAGMFSEERRNQTLELLYLTGMSDTELFLGKLLGGLVVASTHLLALAPMLAVSFLCGGISFDLFLATLACFPVVLLFVLAVGVFASVMNRDEGSARVVSVILCLVVGFGLLLPYFMGQALSGSPPFDNSWLCLSPAYGPLLVWRNFSGAQSAEFWNASLISLVWTLFFLGAAAIMLRRNWRSDLEKNRGVAWVSWMDKLSQKVFAARFAQRKKLLHANPFQWLVERDQRPPMLALLIVAGTTLLWLVFWAWWRGAWFSNLNLMITAVVLLVSTASLERYAAAKRIGEDRRDGALELLLTTPLEPAEIVEGQLAGIRVQFRLIRKLLFLLFCGMMVGGFLSRKWTVTPMIEYFIIWAVLLTGAARSARNSVPQTMWIALNTGRPLFAVFANQKGAGTTWGNFANFYNFYNFFNFFTVLGIIGKTLSQFPTGGIGEVIFIGFGFFIWILFLSSRFFREQVVPMQTNLIQEMRSVATDPVPDPQDPRYKKWSPKERFYPKQYYNYPTLPRPFPRNIKLD